MAKNKKWILAAVAVLAVVLCCWAAWSKWASTTRIGLVNFQNYQTASLVKSNEDNFIEYEEIPLDRLDRLGRYDLVLGFGMGLKITEEQRAQILAAADEGTPIYIYAATNPENDICSLDSLTKAGISPTSATATSGITGIWPATSASISTRSASSSHRLKKLSRALRTCSTTWTKTFHSRRWQIMRNTSGNREFIGRKPLKSQS